MKKYINRRTPVTEPLLRNGGQEFSWSSSLIRRRGSFRRRWYSSILIDRAETILYHRKKLRCSLAMRTNPWTLRGVSPPPLWLPPNAITFEKAPQFYRAAQRWQERTGTGCSFTSTVLFILSNKGYCVIVTTNFFKIFDGKKEIIR